MTIESILGGKMREWFKIGDFSISIQTRESTYCTPRSNVGPWTHVELGYPSEKPPDEIMQYCESPEKPTNTVYGWVPVESVVNWLKSKGATDEQLKQFGFREKIDGVVLE